MKITAFLFVSAFTAAFLAALASPVKAEPSLPLTFTVATSIVALVAVFGTILSLCLRKRRRK